VKEKGKVKGVRAGREKRNRRLSKGEGVTINLIKSAVISGIAAY
jgi:hypothetical protein